MHAFLLEKSAIHIFHSGARDKTGTKASFRTQIVQRGKVMGTNLKARMELAENLALLFRQHESKVETNPSPNDRNTTK